MSIEITKVVCNKKNCPNENEIYYLRDATENIMCGGCKELVKGQKLTESEIESIFDYDLTIGGLGS